ncbi:MAG: hypothetical protein DRI75_11990 [Bacteroidetes bacterium]|nr:MAG: hypothetical protein DRI75_11990 [Bacteroidota bacterium]
MGFKKNNKLGKGRIKGSKNSTEVIKDTFKQLLEANLEGIQKDLDILDPKDRLNFLLQLAGYETSIEIRKRVTAARDIQTKRFKDSKSVHYNAQMNTKQISKYCKLDEASKILLKTAMERLNLSARVYDHILKVSRTIADIEGVESINGSHISEAIQYRSLDREGWLG